MTTFLQGLINEPQHALEFTRLNGRDIKPKFSRIPAGTTPAEEITAFMYVMKKIGAKVKEITAGVEWSVHLTEAGQIYNVRLVELADDQQPIEYLKAGVVIVPVGDGDTEKIAPLFDDEIETSEVSK